MTMRHCGTKFSNPTRKDSMTRDPFAPSPRHRSVRRGPLPDNRVFVGLGLTAVFMMLLSVLLTVAMWGGIIYAAFWTLNHFNVI